MAPLSSRLQPRDVSIERGSQPNRFQSQWLISAYEKIIPSAPQRSSSPVPPAGSVGEVTGRVNDMR